MAGFDPEANWLVVNQPVYMVVKIVTGADAKVDGDIDVQAVRGADAKSVRGMALNLDRGINNSE